jgi:hypothetical protein
MAGRKKGEGLLIRLAGRSACAPHRSGAHAAFPPGGARGGGAHLNTLKVSNEVNLDILQTAPVSLESPKTRRKALWVGRLFAACLPGSRPKKVVKETLDL